MQHGMSCMCVWPSACQEVVLKYQSWFALMLGPCFLIDGRQKLDTEDQTCVECGERLHREVILHIKFKGQNWPLSGIVLPFQQSATSLPQPACLAYPPSFDLLLMTRIIQDFLTSCPSAFGKPYKFSVTVLMESDSVDLRTHFPQCPPSSVHGHEQQSSSCPRPCVHLLDSFQVRHNLLNRPGSFHCIPPEQFPLVPFPEHLLREAPFDAHLQAMGV